MNLTAPDLANLVASDAGSILQDSQNLTVAFLVSFFLSWHRSALYMSTFNFLFSFSNVLFFEECWILLKILEGFSFKFF